MGDHCLVLTPQEQPRNQTAVPADLVLSKFSRPRNWAQDSTTETEGWKGGQKEETRWSSHR